MYSQNDSDHRSGPCTPGPPSAVANRACHFHVFHSLIPPSRSNTMAAACSTQHGHTTLARRFRHLSALGRYERSLDASDPISGTRCRILRGHSPIRRRRRHDPHSVSPSNGSGESVRDVKTCIHRAGRCDCPQQVEVARRSSRCPPARHSPWRPLAAPRRATAAYNSRRLISRHGGCGRGGRHSG